MAKKENTLLLKREHFLEMLLKEGKKYLIVLEELYNCCRKDSLEYKRMLVAMDGYSRCKTQLKEDMEDLHEIFDMDDFAIDDDEETEEEEEFVEMDLDEYELQEEQEFFLEEQCRYCHNIAYRRNVLANIEILILKMLNTDGMLANFQLSVHSKLTPLLKNYCERVKATLNLNSISKKSLNKLETEQLSIQDKCKQLQQLLEHVTERHTFFINLVDQSSTSDVNIEGKSN